MMSPSHHPALVSWMPWYDTGVAEQWCLFVCVAVVVLLSWWGAFGDSLSLSL